VSPPAKSAAPWFPYLGCRGAEQIPVNQNEICPFAGLERADGAFLVLGVSGVKGEGAERFYPRHGLFGMPASEPPAIRVPGARKVRQA